MFIFCNFSAVSIAQTPCVNGLANGFPCNKVTLMSFIPLSELGANAANDIWGWTSPNTHKEYAIIGLQNGYAFIDMTDPINPIKIGNLPTSSGNSTWGDIKVDENYAYLVSESSGHHIQVFNLLQLDDVTNPPIIFEEDKLVLIGSGNAHNIVVDTESSFIYSVGTRSLCGGGPVAFDLADPANPVLAGGFSADGYSHDAMCFVYKGSDTEHVGKQICIGFNEDSFTVIDVTNKKKPKQLSKAGYEHVSYTHQGWLTDDHRYLLLNDELDEQDEDVNTSTYLFDLSDLDNPVYLNTHFGNSASIDHNLYVKGNYAYEANYAEGLRIKDMSNIQNGELTEVAFFDFYPANNNPAFFSVWSSYPYFKSGNIAVSDYEEGFYIVKAELPHFVVDLPNEDGLQKICAGEDAVYEINLTAYANFSNNVTLSLSGLPPNATHSFSNNNLDPNGSSTLTISNLESNTKHSFLLTATADGCPAHNIALAATVLPTSSQPTPVKPLHQAINLPISFSLEWTSTGEFHTYNLEVATDVNFTQIVFSKNNMTDLGYTLKDLQASTTYFWRVSTSPTACYNAPTNPNSLTAQSFTTANFNCATSSNNTTTGFPAIGLPVIVSTISIAQGGTIADVHIKDLNLTHPNVGNLLVTLTSPALTQITLFSSPSGGTCNQDNILASFNDFAFKDYNKFNSTCDHADNAANLPFTAYAIQDEFRPMNAFSAFNGENMQGNWVLSVANVGSADVGTLNGWTLEICSSEDVILDIDLVNFTATTLDQSILVSWATEREHNQTTYYLQRSLSATDGFVTIANIEANFEKQFNYTDKDVKSATTYFYRLVQINAAGKEEISNVINARLMPESEHLQLIPNPAKDVVQILLHGLGQHETAKVSLWSMDGRLVQETLQNNSMDYLVLKGLASGIYLVKVEMANEVMMKRLFVKK